MGKDAELKHINVEIVAPNFRIGGGVGISRKDCLMNTYGTDKLTVIWQRDVEKVSSGS